MTAGELHKIIEKFAWDAMQEQARTASVRPFEAFARNGSSASLEAQTRETCQANGVPLSGPVDDNILLSAVGEVFNSAKSLGLVMYPTCHVRDMSPGGYVLQYQFTEGGRGFFSSGEVSLSTPGLLAGRVREAVSQGHIEPGVVPLVEEAQRCWGMGCLRAAMVLIGLASEEVCTGLLDELCGYPLPPSASAQLHSDWKKLNDEGAAFYTRWQSGLKILETIKRALKKDYGSTKPGWWNTWEPLPGAIQPYAEAVRIARNTAAHSVDDMFTPAQVGLLLASLPTMLTVIAELTEFVKSPPRGVQLPSLI